ncbi:MAG: HAMP domain-containing sensor histidine kinase [Erysipelotrichaceae bacterium]|nr:HAMP domain-containing sensor histidine kinase [Erysipelotrichaceae bacterium]MDD4642466.1 HAMP domain-containing sensor histidine kinase [Erysipelotrichaceae bacterium]
MRKKKKPINLLFFLSLSVFFVLILTMIVAMALVFLFISMGMLKDLSEMSLLKSFILLAIISIIMGTILTTLIGNTILSPFRVLNKAMKKLAGGDFSVRVNLSNRIASYEFEELSASFNSMAEQLGSVEMLRSDFVNNFSHEFKTPIVSLKGFAKILKSKDLSDGERNEFLDIIISEAERLTILSQNVLSLSKIENQLIVTNNELYDISEQVRCAILLLDQKWKKKLIQFDVDIDEIKFKGNEELLNQVFINLIDNAIKFSNENSTIKVKLTDYDDHISFVIIDQGLGMDQNTQRYIFDKFYQGDNSHATEGNGIGLTIVKKIIELYNGSIIVDSKPYLGTTIQVDINKLM